MYRSAARRALNLTTPSLRAEMLTFAFPALLGGALVAGLPWLIHLILRPRPQRVRFPAVTLLRPVLIAGRRASKLRNLWLLAIRTLAILPSTGK